MSKKPASFLDAFKGFGQKKGSGKDKEVEKYEKILQEQPDDRNALNGLGDLYAKRGDAEKACEYYLRVGDLYAKDGFALKAIAVFKKAQRAKPEQISTYLQLADMYVQKGLIGEAKTNYLAAAEMQAAAGQKHDSLDTYRKIADLDPANIKIRAKLAAMYEGENFMVDAALIYLDIGDALIQSNQTEGKEHYQRALALQPENEDVLSRIAYSYSESGLRKEAEGVFATLSKMFPKNPDYREQLELLAGPAPSVATPTLPKEAIVFSTDELSSLNFGDEEVAEPSIGQEHMLEFDSNSFNLTDVGASADHHSLDFQIEDQGSISWTSDTDEETFAPDVAAQSQSLDFDFEEKTPAVQPSPPPAVTPPSQPVAQPAPSSGGFFDLASRLDTSFNFEQNIGGAQPQQTASLKIQAPEKLATSEVKDIVKEFKQGVLEEVGAEDYETHYELGISYKEMSLLDDAIEELKLASLEPSKFVECQSVIALCYLEKGEYNQAIQALQEARARVGKGEQRYQDLTYQIASSYEDGGRVSEAAHIFQELFQMNPGYRDVKNRLNRLLA
ncbi:tetratricopeptide repeat protein [Candidatus Moduliflexus flocculans]|uniref:Tetratricopeptide repeat protein n=1 Tax=Candidatus Moduliflexus flocculans TaxID=1499966 RepID=A0A0S6W0E9_9BACT|nr:tetratricopeptide repeat protein [Candidatus Moduliflexus flocculans]